MAKRQSEGKDQNQQWPHGRLHTRLVAWQRRSDWESCAGHIAVCILAANALTLICSGLFGDR